MSVLADIGNRKLKMRNIMIQVKDSIWRMGSVNSIVVTDLEQLCQRLSEGVKHKFDF